MPERRAETPPAEKKKRTGTDRVRRRICLLLTVTVLSCMGCAKAQPISGMDFVLDTVAELTIYDSRDESLLTEAFSLCRSYEALFSPSVSSSDIARLNAAKGAWTELSPETVSLLAMARQYGELTDGAFDVTIYPVSSLWDFHGEENRPPSEEKIREALSHVNWRGLIVDQEGSRARLEDPAAAVDPGGIAKGFIADRMREYLVKKGVKSAIINLGGNVLVIGRNVNGTPFRVGILKPFSRLNEFVTSVDAENSSVVTSGSSQRYFEYEGRLYHHILDPSTGYPADTDLLSVTIQSPESVDGDALSTACFLLGSGGARDLIRRIREESPGEDGTGNKTVRAVLVLKDGTFETVE